MTGSGGELQLRTSDPELTPDSESETHDRFAKLVMMRPKRMSTAPIGAHEGGWPAGSAWAVLPDLDAAKDTGNGRSSVRRPSERRGGRRPFGVQAKERKRRLKAFVDGFSADARLLAELATRPDQQALRRRQPPIASRSQAHVDDDTKTHDAVEYKRIRKVIEVRFHSLASFPNTTPDQI